VNRLWKFAGGVRLKGFKHLSNSGEINKLALPKTLIIPLRQHIGAPSEPIVTIGDYVLKGQVIAQGNGFISAPIHASSSGTVTAIKPQPTAHPSALEEDCIVIRTDGKDQWIETTVNNNINTNNISEQRQRIRDAGIVGLGGAVFPSAAKLKPTRAINTLIINGAECEPYITCDDALMRKHAIEVIYGAMLVFKIVDAKEIVIGVEDNKPEAIETLKKTLNKLLADSNDYKSIAVIAVPTIFPAGGEKQLIKTLTGKEVPSKGLPYEVGVVCINIATTVAIYHAINYQRPLISRIVTVTGDNVGLPGNYNVLFGTPIDFLLKETQTKLRGSERVLQGGPMMGNEIVNLESPVTKASNCILIKKSTAESLNRVTLPCIRCGQCALVCPMKLLPQQLYWHSRNKAFEELEKYHIGDCIECGCCSVACPSNLELVHYFKFAKTAISGQVRDKTSADIARIRSEARNNRIERIERERIEKNAKRKADRKKSRSRVKKQNDITTSNSSMTEETSADDIVNDTGVESTVNAI